LTEHIDPFEHIPEEYIDENLEIALEDPSSPNYRSNDKDIVDFETEDRLIDHVSADLANKNVGVRYDHQDIEERYIVVMKRAGIALVESHANMSTDSGLLTTVNYHVVTPELGLMYDGDGYVETANELPRQAAIKAPELLEKADQVEEVDFSSVSVLEPSTGEENDPSYVPPPSKDPLFED